MAQGQSHAPALPVPAKPRRDRHKRPVAAWRAYPLGKTTRNAVKQGHYPPGLRGS